MTAKRNMHCIRICILFVSFSFLWICTAGTVSAEAKTDHVIIMVLDGLRPDAISATSTPILHRLAVEGLASFTAQTVFPSKTLPAIVSLVSGVDPSVHGVKTNNPFDLLGFSGETLFSIAKQSYFSTGAIVSKKDVAPLAVPSILDYARFPKRVKYWPMDRVVKEFQEILSLRAVNLFFVHFNEPDVTGHEHGWMSKKYFKAVKKADRAVGEIVNSATKILGEKSYTLIITADHGGHGRGHGTRDPQDMTIPWIAWGKDVKKDTRFTSSVGILDIAPTALWLLGIPVPASLQGRAVYEIFE